MSEIATEEGYASALVRVAWLMDIEGRSQTEDAELSRLAAMVEAYEDEHFPIPSPTKDQDNG